MSYDYHTRAHNSWHAFLMAGIQSMSCYWHARRTDGVMTLRRCHARPTTPVHHKPQERRSGLLLVRGGS